MWFEQKGDLLIIGQGMGENAYLFYHRFWGFVAKADCPTAEQVANNGDKCEFTLTLSQQAKATKIENLIKHYCGGLWGKLSFKIKWVESDWVGLPSKLDLIVKE